MPSGAFEALSRTKTVYLTTSSASGKSGTVQIWFFQHDGRIYFCSRRDTLKVRRIRRNGLALLNIGRRTGPQLACTATILDHDLVLQDRLLRTYRRRYWLTWLFVGPRIRQAFDRDEEVIIELTPTDPPDVELA